MLCFFKSWCFGVLSERSPYRADLWADVERNTLEHTSPCGGGRGFYRRWIYPLTWLAEPCAWRDRSLYAGERR